MLAGRLEIGLNTPLLIREERLSERSDACRLLYASDIHLRRGRSAKLAAQLVNAAQNCGADVILLGGDLVDRSSELGHLQALVKQLVALGPVFAVGGNHDHIVGYGRVRGAVIRGGGTWIHDATTTHSFNSRVLSISGPGFKGKPDGDVRVLCGHNPRVWRTSRHAGYDLVLAGHLHGCQFVAFEFRGRLFPGAAFFPYNYLSDQFGTARLVVSRGVSDLVPIRWRCPREVVLCYV